MANDIISEVAKNRRWNQNNFSQRRSAVSRVVGAELIIQGSGSGSTYLTLDNDMEYISEMKFKLVLGGFTQNGDATAGTAFFGTDTWKTPQDFLNQFPVGTAIDVDGVYGAQCYDYINAFWMGQVNRYVQSNDDARGIWAMRTVNAGTEFDLITDFNSLEFGDWAIWADGEFGHGGMVGASPSGGKVLLYGQNQGGIPWGDGGAAISTFNASSSGFAGAFRYKKWH